jgi:hypothetical protein
MHEPGVTAAGGLSMAALCLTFLAAPVPSSASDAGTEPRWSVHVSAGRSYPQDGYVEYERPRSLRPLGMIFDAGGAARIGVGYRFIDRFETVAEIEYARLAFDPDNNLGYSTRSAILSVSAEDGASVIALGLAARFWAPLGRKEAFGFSFIAGGGAARVSYDVFVRETGFATTLVAFRETAPSLVGELGADSVFGKRITVGLEWRYRHTLTSREHVTRIDEVEHLGYGTIGIAATVRLGGVTARHVD